MRTDLVSSHETERRVGRAALPPRYLIRVHTCFGQVIREGQVHSGADDLSGPVAGHERVHLLVRVSRLGEALVVFGCQGDSLSCGMAL